MNLLIQIFARATVVEDDIGARAFLRERHLRADAGAGFLFRQFVARHEALDLELLWDGRDPDLVGVCVPAGFEQQRHVEHDDVRVFFPQPLETAPQFRFEHGMRSAVEPGALRRIAKDDCADGAAVERRVLRQDALAPMREVKIVERLLRLHELVRHLVRVDDLCAEGLED